MGSFTNTGSGNVGAAWTLRLTYDVTQPNTTTTQIALKLEIYNTTGYAYNNYTSGSDAPYYKLGQGSVSSLSAINFTYNYSNTAQWHTLGAKTITITDPSVRNIVVSGMWHSKKTDYTPGNITVTGTIENLPLLKTACIAPTEIILTGTTDTITKPSDPIKISWSGAESGVNNTITGYDVYINCTSTGSVPSNAETVSNIYRNVTGTSLNITTADLTFTRGYKIRVKVRAKGDDENYYSGFAASSTLLVNQLPSAPTATSKTVFSSVEKTTISATAGAMNSGFSTPSVWYSDSATGTKKEYSSTTSFGLGNQGTSKTYYFWTFDGYEYSNSYATATLTRNKAPKINSSSFTGTTCTVYGFDATLKTPVNVFSGSLTLNKSNVTCKVTMKYGALNGAYATYSSFPNTISNVSFGSLSGTKFSFSNIDPRTYIPFGSTFAIKIEVTDTMGESDSKEFLSFDGSSLALCVADFPTAIDYYNGAAGTVANHFYRQITFYYIYDSYFKDDIESCFNCSSLNATPKVISVTNDTEKFAITIDVGTNLTSGAAYTFINTLSKKNKTSAAASWTLIQCRAFNGTTKNTISLRPFTDGANGTTKDFEISMSNGSALAGESDFYNYYDIDGSTWDWCKTYIKYNGKQVEIKEVEGGFSFSASLAADYFKKEVSFSGSVMFDLLNELGITNKNTSYTMTIVNKITNKFGKEDTYEISLLAVNYNEMPYGGFKVSGAPAVKILYNDNLYDYPTGALIAEGLTLVFVPVATTYNFENYRYVIQKSTNGTSWEDYIIENDERSFVNNASFGKPSSIPFTSSLSELLKIIIGEISSSEPCYFRVGLKIGNYETVYSDSTTAFGRQKHVQTPISINSAAYENEKLKFNYTYGPIGFISNNFSKSDSSISYEVSFKEVSSGTRSDKIFSGEYSEWAAKSDSVQIANPSFDMKDKNGAGTVQTYAFVRLKLASKSITHYSLEDSNGSKIDYTISVEKVYETEALTIYNAAQTISYRPNHIGINTGSFDETDVVRINATATRYIMALESSGGLVYLDLSTGELIGKDVNYSPDDEEKKKLSSRLNLFNGQFSGVSIDCGEITS